jgi:hypothetical protein
MMAHLSLRSLPWLTVLSVISCKGCFAGTSTHTTEAPLRAEGPLSPPHGGGDDLQILDTSVFLSAGEPDFKNRYLSTVMVTTGNAWESKICSGIFISPNMALTAAHCVCERRKATAPGQEDTVIVEGSACVEKAYVTTVAYDPVKARIGTGGQTQVYEGTVLPHPEFKLVLDRRGHVVSGTADLALLRLDEQVEGAPPGLSLADTAAEAGEVLTMAGYGNGGAAGSLHGLRYVRKNKVTRASTPADERVLYEQQGAYLYNGFEGGPCFRENDKGRWLVGIASLGSEEELILTDLHPYREWLLAATRGVGEIQSLPEGKGP